MNTNCTLENERSTRIPMLGKNARRILDVLGEDVVLIPVKFGTKQPTLNGWPRLNLSCMEDAEHLHALERGNIGVLLGKASGHLVSIDLDRDEDVEPFLNSNPRLRNTTRTRRTRGCNLWVKMDGPYPASSKGTSGEWRADGNQTVIFGTANGVPYRFLSEVPPIRLTFGEIVFPNGWFPTPPPLHTTSSATLLNCSAALSLCKVLTIDEAVELALPTVGGSNNAALFTLARAIKTLEAQGVISGQAQRIGIFDQWHRQAAGRGILRTGQSRDAYLLEFLNAYRRVKHLLGTAVVDRAWAAAQTEPFPPESAVFETDAPRRFVSLCHQMHLMADGGAWFIPTRTVARFLGVTHTTAATWFGGLVALGILRITQKHARNRATRYQFNQQSYATEKRKEL